MCAHVATGGPVHLVLSLRKASGRVVQGGVGRAMPCHAMPCVWCVCTHLWHSKATPVAVAVHIEPCVRRLRTTGDHPFFAKSVS